jgi:pimeloyl-ACP methyl ester carboxylesterase
MVMQSIFSGRTGSGNACQPQAAPAKKARAIVWMLVAAVLAAVMVLPDQAAQAAGPGRWLNLPEPPPMPTAKESGKAPVNGIQMYYAVYGSGTPILLIHGGLGNADIWANQVITLSKTHEVIVADSRGHGRSTRTADPFGYDLMASDYLALLDYLKIKQVAIVGWSDGGIIGIDIAMHHPDRLTRLFAQAANVTTDGVRPDVMENKTFEAYIDRMGEEYKRLSPTPDQYDAFVAQISHMWESQPAWTAADLAQVGVPTEIVLGDHDEAIKRTHAELMVREIPGAKLIILKNVSHFACLQDPEGYSKAVLKFLK